MNKAIFEIDDYPWDAENCIRYLDILKNENDDFKGTVYCITGEMTEELEKPFLDRPWLQMAAHGINHNPGECMFSDIGEFYKLLRKIDKQKYHNLFKAPRYGYSIEHVIALHRSGFIASIRNVKDIFGIDRRDQKRVEIKKTNLGLNVFLAETCEEYTFYHRHTGKVCITDIKHRFNYLVKSIKEKEFYFSQEFVKCV